MITNADAAYKTIQRMLTNGEFSPGQRLSQVKIARKLGCSTVPVVEAMRRLESDGLLTKTARKMAKVRVLSLRELKGLYLLRANLEGVLAYMCAERITDEEIARLRELNQESVVVAENQDLPGDVRLEVEIHQHIAACARCPILAEELKRLLLVERTAGRTQEASGPVIDMAGVLVHRAVIEAIADHDAHMAEYLMRRHIKGGFQSFLKKYRALKGSKNEQ